MVFNSMNQKHIPIFIPAFNNPYYLEKFCKQKKVKNNFNIYIFDNKSNYKKTFEFYEKIKGTIKIIQFSENFGPRAFWMIDDLYQRLPEIFCISDPDIEFSYSIPHDFLLKLFDLTNRFQIGKAGFALDIADSRRLVQKKFRHADGWKHIWESEAEHWINEIINDPVGEPIYLADIDTTFALYNKKYFDRSAPFNAIRVGGRFTARHLPWYVDNAVPDEEREFYDQTALYSYYSSNHPPLQLRELFTLQDALPTGQEAMAITGLRGL